MITVDGGRTRSGLANLKAGIRQAAGLTLDAAIEAAKASAKSTTLWKDQSGTTRSSIRSERTGLRGFVEAGGAAKFLEEGTKPHLIVAHGKALRFVVEGNVLFRKWVRHPGTAPRPFMREARQRGETAAEWAAEIYVNSAIQRVRA